MRRFLIVLILLGSPFAGERLCHFLTDGFYESRIVTDLPNQEIWETHIPPPEGALTQTYHYLSCGGQCFVFESDDHQFVLKFFKHHRWKNNLLNRLRRDMVHQKKVQELTLMSVIYAIKYFHDESLVDYVHLNREGTHLPTITCVDRIRRKHHFDLNKYQFIIQRKGCTLLDRLIERKNYKDLEGAKQDIRKSLDLLASCHHKGIKNQDPYMTRNFGFVENTPIVIDSGAFCEYQEQNTAPLPARILERGVGNLLKWTDQYWPPLSKEIEEWTTAYYSAQ